MEHFNAAYLLAFVHIAASLALLNGVTTVFGQAKVAATAITAIARQPEARGNINSTMFIGLAMCETAGIYGMVIAIIMLFANPVLGQWAHLLG